MERLTLAAVCGLLLSLQAMTLQAQKPEGPPSPGYRRESQNAPTPIGQPVPQESLENRNELTLQLGSGQKVQEDEQAAEFSKYPIWLLIKPDGIQFLQHQEEIATNQHAIPPNAFLLGCTTVKFEGAAGEQTPDFQLSCEEFLLLGRYGTKQNLDVKGASLSYSTRSKQIRLKGTEELPLELHSVDAASETRMRADEITLQLDSGPKTVTRFVPRKVVKSGLPMTEYVPVTEQMVQGSSFQLSARNITALEVIANPDPNGNQPARGDAPVWNPDAGASGVPTYDTPFGVPTYDDRSGNLAPTPKPHNIPYYDDSSRPDTYRRGKEVRKLDPIPNEND